MGIQDRDYWKERYNKNGSQNPHDSMDPHYWQRDKPFTSGAHELSFLAKLIITLVLLLIAAIAYRYQAEILGLLRGPEIVALKRQEVAVRPPAITAARPEDLARTDTAPPAPSAQVFRCGSSYSNTPCANGREVEVAVNQRQDLSATKEIYLCKDHYDRLSWESVPCSTNRRFMDRIARVPSHLSWNEQVAIAREQRDRARAIANEQVVAVAPRGVSGKANASECQALDEHINWLDSLGRIGGGGYTMDWIHETRRLAIRC